MVVPNTIVNRKGFEPLFFNLTTLSTSPANQWHYLFSKGRDFRPSLTCIQDMTARRPVGKGQSITHEEERISV